MTIREWSLLESLELANDGNLVILNRSSGDSSVYRTGSQLTLQLKYFPGQPRRAGAPPSAGKEDGRLCAKESVKEGPIG